MTVFCSLLATKHAHVLACTPSFIPTATSELTSNESFFGIIVIFVCNVLETKLSSSSSSSSTLVFVSSYRLWRANI
jgi:hypothetical protein